MIYAVKDFLFLLIVRLQNPTLKLFRRVTINKKDYFKKLITLGKNVQLLNNTFLTGKIQIGDYSYLNNNTELLASEKYQIKIGKFCSIARNCFIASTNDHDINCLTTYPISQYLININKNKKHKKNGKEKAKEKKDLGGDVIIGHDVWIGANTTILPNTEIGNGAVIGANSLITQKTTIPPYEIWAGNPAKKIKDRFPKEKQEQIQKIKWWDWPMEQIKKNHQMFE